MSNKQKIRLLSLAVLGLMIFTVPSQAAPPNQKFSLEALQVNSLMLFEAQLSGAEEVPAVPTTGSGRAVMVYDSQSKQLYYRVLVSELDAISQAHIHTGAVGENGPVVITLFPNGGTGFSPDEPVSGSVGLDDAKAGDLLAGNYYVNVHTSSYPAGEIRGQLELVDIPAHYGTRLAGDEEVPPVATGASGTAIFTVNAAPEMSSLIYHLEVSGLGSLVTGAHLHTGWPGQGGPVALSLYSPSGGIPFGPGNPLHGEVEISAQDVLDLVSGYFFVNVHSQDYPDGEIRGQVTTNWRLFIPIVQQ